MNCRFEYLYRNASNYKSWGAVVFSGVANEEIERRLVAAMDSFEFFIAEQIRVPELFFHDKLTPGDDSCWHEFVKLEPTTEEPTDALARSIVAFVLEIEAASLDGWQVFDPMKRLPV